MGKILSSKEYADEVAALKAGHPYLDAPASGLETVKPGHLAKLRETVELMDKIGTVDFFRIDARPNPSFESGSDWRVHFHCAGDDGRKAAMSDLAGYLVAHFRSACPYCGAERDRNIHSARCAHPPIVSGQFSDDIVYFVEPEDEELIDGGEDEMEGDATEVRERLLGKVFDGVDIALRLGACEKTKKVVESLRNLSMVIGENSSAIISNYVDEEIATLAYLETERFTARAAGHAKEIVIDGPCVRLYETEKMESVYAKCSAYRERKLVLDPYKSKMEELGPVRRLALLPDDWKAELADLDAEFPNFAEVLMFVRHQFALGALGDGRFAMPPIALNGPAGVGKTYFAKRLADLVSTGYLEIHMETEQTSSALAGSASFWANTKPGKLFEVLACGETANPVVLVDEIDKSGPNMQYDPLAPLYSLLEPHTAERFEDASFSFPLDASHVSWICTSNEIGMVAQPLQSRLRVFEVKEPTFEEARGIAQNIYKLMLAKAIWGKHFEPELDDAVVDSLAELGPRLMRTTLSSALGAAALNGRRAVEIGDLADMGHKEKRIGF